MAGGGLQQAGSSSPILVDLNGADFIDIDLRDFAALIQFGDENVADNFDVNVAKFHRKTYVDSDTANFPGFGVYTIGVPAGATHMAILGAGGTVRFRVREEENFVYGGAQVVRTATNTTVASNCILRREFAVPIPAGTSFSVVAMATRAAAQTGVAGNIVNISPASSSGVKLNPRMALGCGTANTAQLTVTNSAGAGVAQFAQLGWDNQERTLLGAVYDNDIPGITLYRYGEQHGFEARFTTCTANGSIDADLTHIHIGGTNASLNGFAGELFPVRVMLGKMTPFQFIAHAGPNAPWWPLLDNLVDVAFVPGMSSDPLLEVISGGSLEAGSGLIGNLTFPAASSQMKMGLLNRLDVQNSGNVRYTAYSTDDGTNVSFGSAKSGLYVGYTTSTLDYDVGADPDPDNADARLITADRQVLIGKGASQLVDIQSDASGVVTGILNTVALTRKRSYGEKEWVHLGTFGSLSAGNSLWQDQEMARNRINGKIMMVSIIGANSSAAAARAEFGYLDNVTGRWENETSGGAVYVVAGSGSITGYPGVGKGWHWAANKSGIHGFSIASIGGGDFRLGKWTCAFDNITGDFASSTGSAISTNFAHSNPLAAWAPSQTKTAIIFAGGDAVSAVQYQVDGTGTLNHFVTKAEDGKTGYRAVGQAEICDLDPLQETTKFLATHLSVGTNYGQIIEADWVAKTRTVKTAVAGLTGTNILYDPSSIYDRERGRTIYCAFSGARSHVSFFEENATEPFLSVAASDIWEGTTQGSASLFFMSTEMIIKPDPSGGTPRSGVTFSIIDHDDFLGNIPSAHEVQMWALYTGGSVERFDYGALDGIPREGHETEVIYSDPDPNNGFLREMWIQYDEFLAGAAGMTRPVLCKTGRFFRRLLDNTAHSFTATETTYATAEPGCSSFFWQCQSDVYLALESVSATPEHIYVANGTERFNLKPGSNVIAFRGVQNADMPVISWTSAVRTY